jgi:hypothetical protein
MRNQHITFPSLSGTFGIHTRLTLNPKMPKSLQAHPAPTHGKKYNTAKGKK